MFRINERPLLAHYTAITCLRSVGIGAGIGEIITDTDTGSIGRYPIPDTGIGLSLLCAIQL